MATNQRSTGFRRWLAGTPALLVPILLVPVVFADPGEDTPTPSAASASASAALSLLETRTAVVEDGLARVDEYYRDEVEPVERMLEPYHADGDWVRRIAFALVREADHTGLDSRALASVLLVENPWLTADAVSPVGAVGLMQVMPMHAGRWNCGSTDLEAVEVNICHGARIFAAYLARHGDLDRALLAYNGCVKGTNTPDCHMYPNHVYSRAGRAAMQRWLRVE